MNTSQAVVKSLIKTMKQNVEELMRTNTLLFITINSSDDQESIDQAYEMMKHNQKEINKQIKRIKEMRGY